jgi:NADH dehydrogenase
LQFPLAELLGIVLERLLPHPPLTRDQVRLLQTDKVISGTEPTLADLGISPSALESFLPELNATHSPRNPAR